MTTSKSSAGRKSFSHASLEKKSASYLHDMQILMQELSTAMLLLWSGLESSGIFKNKRAAKLLYYSLKQQRMELRLLLRRTLSLHHSIITSNTTIKLPRESKGLGKYTPSSSVISSLVTRTGWRPSTRT